MLKELKAPQKDSQAWCNQSDHLQMAEDILAAVRRVRREVVESMRILMKFAKEKDVETAKSISKNRLQSAQIHTSELNTDVPVQMVEDMLKKTNLMQNCCFSHRFTFYFRTRFLKKAGTFRV